MLTAVMVLASVFSLVGAISGIRLYIYLRSGQADIDARFDTYCR